MAQYVPLRRNYFGKNSCNRFGKQLRAPCDIRHNAERTFRRSGRIKGNGKTRTGYGTRRIFETGSRGAGGKDAENVS